jgi:hypothetical protein
MKLIDLSREIHHKMQRFPNHPMVIISQFTDHNEKRVADGYEFSSAVLSLNMGDHSGTMSTRPFISTSVRVRSPRGSPARGFLHRGGLPRSVAQAIEKRYLYRRPGSGRENRRCRDKAGRYGPAPHGLLQPDHRNRGLYHRFSGPDQRVGDLAGARGHQNVRCGSRESRTSPAGRTSRCIMCAGISASRTWKGSAIWNGWSARDASGSLGSR